MKSKKHPFNSRCNVVKAKVILEDMDVSDNSAKTRVVRKYSLARPKTKL
jgi:hypothetical protein